MIEVVVRSQTAGYANSVISPLPCVEERTAGVSVGGGGRRHPGNNVGMFWYSLEGDGRGGRRSLSAGDQEAAREAMRAALSASTQRRWVAWILPAWMSPSLSFCTGSETRRLSFGSPVIVGDVAFVFVDYICQLCGQADVFALRRNSRGWVTVAIRNVFMS